MNELITAIAVWCGFGTTSLGLVYNNEACRKAYFECLEKEDVDYAKSLVTGKTVTVPVSKSIHDCAKKTIKP